jgi:hypothetical protein
MEDLMWPKGVDGTLMDAGERKDRQGIAELGQLGDTQIAGTTRTAPDEGLLVE